MGKIDGTSTKPIFKIDLTLARSGTKLKLTGLACILICMICPAFVNVKHWLVPSWLNPFLQMFKDFSPV